MTNEERVMSLFERANPAPEHGQIAPRTSASRYLDDIQRRSSTMTLTTDAHTSTGTGAHEDRPGTAPSHDPRSRRPWLLAAAAAAVIGLVGGLIVLATRADNDPVPADVPEPTVAVEPAAPPEPLPLAQFEEFGPGPYETTLLGVPLTFETTERTILTFLQTGELLFLNADFDTSGVRSWRVTRLGGWHTAEEAGDPEFSEPATIDPYDVDAWFDEGYVIGERLDDTVVGGRLTEVYDIVPTPDSGLDAGCPAEQLPCFFPTSVSEESFDRFTARDEFRRVGGPGAPDTETRLWLVTIDGFDPILIDAAGEAGWVDTFESTILDSIGLGPDGPPLQAV